MLMEADGGRERQQVIKLRRDTSDVTWPEQPATPPVVGDFLLIYRIIEPFLQQVRSRFSVWGIVLLNTKGTPVNSD